MGSRSHLRAHEKEISVLDSNRGLSQSLCAQPEHLKNMDVAWCSGVPKKRLTDTELLKYLTPIKVVVLTKLPVYF